MGSKKIGLVFFAIAAVIIIPSLMNFNVFSDAKAAYLFDSISGSSYDIYYSEFVDGGHNYTIDGEVSDNSDREGDLYIITVNVSLEIYIDEVSVLNEQTYHYDTYYDHEYRVFDLVFYEFVATTIVNLTISGSFYEGGYLDIKIYQDLPLSFAEQELQIAIIILIGMAFFMIGICILVFGKSKPV
jgi:hypothetical protein